MGMSKISMMNIDKSSYSSSSYSSSYGWTSTFAIFSKLLDVADDHQELDLSNEFAILVITTKDEKNFNISQHIELIIQVGLVIVVVARKVTLE
jgi:hypothetical protein